MYVERGLWKQSSGCSCLGFWSKVNLNLLLSFSEPKFPALVGLLSRFTSLTFNKHPGNTLSEALLLDLYNATQLLSLRI